jgi:hypothetical protein
MANYPAYLSLDNLRERFPKTFSEKQLASAQTLFLKKMAMEMHQFYGGKITTIPKAGVYGLGWFGYLSRAQLYLVVFAVWALMLLWSKPWLARFRYGPFEWAWRSLARWKLQPMTGAAARA